MRRLAIPLAVFAAACGGDAGPIVVGVAGPFGEPRGASMRIAAELAEREINARGGLRGRPLALEFADDRASDTAAMRIARRFREDPRVVAVVGHVTSVATLAALPAYAGPAASGVPVVLVSPSASSPELSGRSRYFFRVCPSDLAHGPRLARFARQDLGTATVAVIYGNDEYGRGLRRTFITEYTRLGGTVVAEDPALPETPSLEPYLSRTLARGGADVLLLAVERALAARALRQMRALGARWDVIGGDALTGLNGPMTDGVHVSSAYLADRAGARNAAFINAYERASRGRRPDHRGAATYDILQLLARVIEAAGPERRAVRDGLARVGTRDPAFDGVTGTIAFDEQGDVPNKPVVIGVVRAGELVSREP